MDKALKADHLFILFQMVPFSSIQFIDTALSRTTSPYSLSYPDPKQKWLIRKHLLSLIQDYPTFTLSADTFTHNDGTTVHLLNATGYLHVSTLTPPIPLTIWLHENYPYMPPLVYVSTSNSMSPIHQHHPFVDLSGATSSPYLHTWVFPHCNLTKLVHNLFKIFSLDHPFIIPHNTNVSPSTSFPHAPSLASKMEAIDRLSGLIHYDMIALMVKNEEEMEGLSKLQVELMERDDAIRSIMGSLEEERWRLKDRVMKLMKEADAVINWLRVNDANLIMGDDAFEGKGEESKIVIDCLGADRAIEDLMYTLEKGVEEGAVPFDDYIRQVRVLARGQFSHRDMLVKIGGSQML